MNYSYINNSFDVSQIGTSLTKSNNSLNESESIAAKTMKKVQANAMMLEKSMNISYVNWLY